MNPLGAWCASKPSVRIRRQGPRSTQLTADQSRALLRCRALGLTSASVGRCGAERLCGTTESTSRHGEPWCEVLPVVREQTEPRNGAAAARGRGPAPRPPAAPRPRPAPATPAPRSTRTPAATAGAPAARRARTPATPARAAPRRGTGTRGPASAARTGASPGSAAARSTARA